MIDPTTAIEEWRVIDGAAQYEVSSLGRVRRTATGLILKPKTKAKGYLFVNLYDRDLAGRPKELSRHVHRLVALAFVANPDMMPEVNHRNAVKTDNTVTNLEWVTRQQNMAHASELMLCRRGERHPHARLTQPMVDRLVHLTSNGLSHTKTAKLLGISRQRVDEILNGETYWRITSLPPHPPPTGTH